LRPSVADLTQKLGAVDKTARAGPADGTALVLLMLQIKEVDRNGSPV